jgi:hypothetical protein
MQLSTFATVSIGVAIALALPAILALGFYAVAESIVLIG